MAPIQESVRTINLGHDQMLILEDPRTGRVRVLHGGVWLTEPGQPRDHFLRAGQEVPVPSGHALVQAQGPTRVEVNLGRRRPVGWWQRLRGMAARWHLGPVPDSCG